MTETNCDFFTHKSSRSYLNHFVYIYCSIRTPFRQTFSKRTYKRPLPLSVLFILQLKTALNCESVDNRALRYSMRLNEFYVLSTPSTFWKWRTVSILASNSSCCGHRTRRITRIKICTTAVEFSDIFFENMSPSLHPEDAGSNSPAHGPS